MGSDNAVYSGKRRIVGDGRSRIIDAFVQLVAEQGYRNVSVALVVARARVSRRTFYEQFNDLEDCFKSVLELSLTMPGELIVAAFIGEEDWRDGVRSALAALLEFFDSEPSLTRVWFGEVLAVGAWALEHRERNIAALRSLIVEHWFPAGAGLGDEVLVNGVMASIIGTIQTHVVTRRPESLITLLAPLTSLVAAPFLDAQAVKVEVQRAEALTRTLLDGRDQQAGDVGVSATQIPAALLLPGARRSRQCLRYLAEQGARGLSPSNQQVGKDLGIAHQSQTSELLRRLAGLGLLSKQGTPGRPSAWTLTPEGQRVTRALENYS